MKYRSRADIIAMNLRVGVNGATKTRTMYGTYLSFAQTKEYLGLLIQKDLMAHEEGSGLYKVTEDGMKLLRVYDGISDLISVDGK